MVHSHSVPHADPSLPFFFQIEAVSAAEHAGGGPLLITAAAADGRARVKQSNLLPADPRRGWRRRSTHTQAPHTPTRRPTEREGSFLITGAGDLSRSTLPVKKSRAVNDLWLHHGMKQDVRANEIECVIKYKMISSLVKYNDVLF